jgi:hypothetical protein
MAKATREKWAARVEEWKQSGKSAVEYAAEIGVRAGTLKWWRWRLSAPAEPQRALVRGAASPLAKVTPAISPITFVEMTAAIDGDRLEVVLPSSTRIRVRPGFDSATLAQLLDVLEARA